MFSRIFILRPRLAAVVNIVITLAGVIGLMNLPVEEYPNISPPTIHVSASYAGASADVVEQTVGMPLEDEINGVEDLLYFSSTSSNDGSYSCSVTFNTGTDSDIALVNLQNAVKRAEAQLPSEVTRTGVSVTKRGSDNLGMIAFLTDGSKLDNAGLVNYVNNTLKDAIARVEGVSSAELMSNRWTAMRIWLDPARLAGLGLSASDVQTAVEASNLAAAAGSVGAEGSSEWLYYKLNVTGRLTTAEEFGDIVVRTEPETGRQVKLRDVARVEIGSESYAGKTLHNGKESVGLGLYRAPDANAMATMNRVKEELKRWEPRFPEGVSYIFGYDPTLFIQVSMEEMVTTLISALVLVIGVTWLFLGDWRATLVPATAIPVSLLGTFAALYLIGFSINTLTMFGLILVIGSLVDDAIVVVENTQRLIDEGMEPREAALESMKEITGAVIATTLVTVACYAPLLFYSGMTGEIYKQFAASMCISLSLSTVVALTLSPALCALVLRRHAGAERGLILRAAEGALDWLKNRYLGGVRALLRVKTLSMLSLAAVVAGIVFLYQTIPASFIPAEDKGMMFVNMELAPGTAQARTEKAMAEMREKIAAIPGVKSTMTMSGQSMMSGSGENVAMCITDLDPWDERTTPEKSLQAIMTRINNETADMAAAEVTAFSPPALMGLGAMGGVSFELCSTSGASPAELAKTAEELNAEFLTMPTVRSAMTSFRADTVQLRFTLDRGKAELLGVTPSDAYSALQDALASYYINDFTLENNNYEVIMQAEPGYRATPKEIEEITVINSAGNLVPLSAIGTVSWETGARELSRFNKMRSASINIQCAEGANEGEVLAQIESMKLPDGYTIEWTGMSRQQVENSGRIVLFTGLAFLFAYLFLVAQYESWVMPVSVMLSVIFAIAGGLIGLEVAGLELSIYAQLGLVMLIGLSAKSAILMVEFSKVKREGGLSPDEAALAGAGQRFRAVMMTAWSFIFGVLPMVFATGAGSASRVAIGVTTFAGMLLASIIGIMFTPIYYSVLEHMLTKLRGLLGHGKAA
ncbi:efflux RND transporter permease subunit [Sutterella sp.]|uniref:efflux RND transporter permease subunit n=1 Tax=Sutterella sp. TaxID=1981025 RepID=UPI0026E01A89|nr:efflux RND transporter permease subunit [Sutterella sp.]MDO5530768.1 efflux RND transporter permease subunit [Sutterella sp.]